MWWPNDYALIHNLLVYQLPSILCNIHTYYLDTFICTRFGLSLPIKISFFSAIAKVYFMNVYGYEFRYLLFDVGKGCCWRTVWLRRIIFRCINWNPANWFIFLSKSFINIRLITIGVFPLFSIFLSSTSVRFRESEYYILRLAGQKSFYSLNKSEYRKLGFRYKGFVFILYKQLSMHVFSFVS